MADGVDFQGATPSYPPTDLKVSSDKTAGGYDVQRVKLAYSADASEVHVTADADGLLVNLGANNDVSVTGTVTVQDGGSSVTVDGTVTANAGSGPWPVTDNAGSLTVDAPVGTPVFVRLSDGSSAIATLPVSLASVPSHAVTNAGTFAVQAAQSGTWAATAYLAQVQISQTPTISASAIYAAGDAVGGLLTFANAARSSGGTLTIIGVTILDYDQELAPLDLFLFDRTFTATSDNAAFAPSDGDMANCRGFIPVTFYANASTNSVGRWSGAYGLKLNGTDLFGQLVARSTPTYTATTDLTVIIEVVQD